MTGAAGTGPCRIAPGEVVDGFEVGELLHEGGMGRVYRCRRGNDDGDPLVLKAPDLDRPGVAAALTAFETEVHILQRVHGRHFPRLHGHGDALRCPYLVIEHLPGNTLSEAVDTAPRPVAEIVGLAVPLCQAVHALHRRHVIHLDIKPANVRNRAEGTPVLVDYGIAHHAQMPDLVDDAFNGAVGSAEYIAPEQLTGVRTEARSDLFAVGVILYRLATGTHPWGTVERVVPAWRRYQPPDPPRAHSRDCPPWLQELILRCLEPDPELRPPTAKQLAYLLMHPSAVQLSARSARTHPADVFERLRFAAAALRMRGRVRRRAPAHLADRLHRAAHVLVAIDPDHTGATLLEELRRTLRKFARNEPHGFFTVLAVVDETPAETADAAASPPAVRAHAFLRALVQPLPIQAARLNFQVLAGSDPAHALIDYAARHDVDHVVIGARGHSALRRLLGSVSSRVVAESHCSVTVVRAPHAGDR